MRVVAAVLRAYLTARLRRARSAACRASACAVRSFVVAALVATLSQYGSLPAQTLLRDIDWAGLRHAADGKTVTLQLRSGASLRGRAGNFSADTLTVNGREVVCAEVAAVMVEKKSRRGWWAAIGGAAGLAAGLVGAKRFTNEGNDTAATGLVIGLAAAGAGLGYLAGGKAKAVELRLEPDACP